jgi:cell division inhibitor SepF
MPGFWKKSLVYFGVIDDVEEFGPLSYEAADPTTVRTIPTTASSTRAYINGDHAEPSGSPEPTGLCIMEPHEFAEGRAIADKLKEHAPIVVNLRYADRDVAKRLVDFACGLSYMSGGQVKKVAGRILLLTPPDVDISVAQAQELVLHSSQRERR